MILLDTHIWVWWVHADPHLPAAMAQAIRETPAAERLVSIISCWEVAKLVELRRLATSVGVRTWLERASEPAVARLMPLTIPIITDATSLPAGFHKDPADQLIVATARTLGAELFTVDEKILQYPHVRTFEG